MRDIRFLKCLSGKKRGNDYDGLKPRYGCNDFKCIVCGGIWEGGGSPSYKVSVKNIECPACGALIEDSPMNRDMIAKYYIYREGLNK